MSNFVDSSGMDLWAQNFEADSSGLTLTLRHEFSIVLVSLFYCLLFFGNIHLVQIVYEIGQNTWVCWSWAWKRIEIMSQWNRNIIQKTLEISTFWCTYLFGKPINNRNIFSLRFLTHKIESLPAGSTLWFIGPRFEVPMNINLEITMLYYQDENSWKLTKT